MRSRPAETSGAFVYILSPAAVKQFTFNIMAYLRLSSIRYGGKKRQYTLEMLSLAYDEVITNGTCVHKAAKMFGIPDSTLRDRFSGPMQPSPVSTRFNTNPGPESTLTYEEEQQLVSHCSYMASIGYGYSRAEFMNLATDFAISLHKKKPSDRSFSQSWYDSFKKRHPDISLAKAQKLSIIRAKSTSQTVLDKYFDSLQSVIDTYDLENKPENIWNVDETGLSMEHTPTSVICEKATRPQAITSNRGKTVTIIAAGSAIGSRIPPYYVFPGKRWNDTLLDGSTVGSAGTVTETGWSNSAVFLDFLKHHFLKYVPSNGSKILLLFDGHKSHVNLTLKEWGEQHNIVFFVIPPHTSHVTQPLDVGCFGPLKRAYYAECQAFMRRSPGLQINRNNIALVSSRAYNKALTPENLISSFYKTGIFPLERKQISSDKTAPSEIYKDSEINVSPELNKIGTNLLEQRKITTVIVNENHRKRKLQPSVHGNLMSPRKESLLKRPALKCENNKKRKLNKKQVDKSPKPSTSGLNPITKDGIPIDSAESYSDESNIDESELCCICKRFTPDTFSNAYTVEFIKWGQCDICDGWVHLKYCTSVKVLRRDTSFLCPNCEK